MGKFRRREAPLLGASANASVSVFALFLFFHINYTVHLLLGRILSQGFIRYSLWYLS